MNKIYEKNKLFVWPAVVVFTIIFVFILVIIPQFVAYLDLKKQIVEINEKAGKLDQKAQQLETIDEIATKQGLQIVFTVLPSDQDAPEAIASVQDSVSQSGLILKSISYIGSGRSVEKNSFQFNTVITGPLSSVRSFLTNMKNSSRLMRVEAISARMDKEGVISEVSLPLSLFYDPTSGGGESSLDQPVTQLTEKEEQLLTELSTSINRVSTASAVEVDTSSIPLGKTNPFE